MEIIPDDAFVVRGGRNHPEDIERGTGIHPSGVSEISVESAAGVPVEQLASAIPHGQIGVTTIDEVREAGGDVVRTSGRSPNHATFRFDTQGHQSSPHPDPPKPGSFSIPRVIESCKSLRFMRTLRTRMSWAVSA
jgi:hypothetical protein